LEAGWNLVGPATDCPVPTNEAIVCIWYWDAETKIHKAVTAEDTLEPGKGYWIYTSKEGCLIETGDQ
jgi:hypothetical protein